MITLDPEEVLHEEARNLMIELDTKYGMDNMISLDEYLCEYIEILSENEIKSIDNLLSRFYNL